MLANRLARPEEHEVITKRPVPGRGNSVHDELTQTGKDLLPVLAEIVNWGAQYEGPTVVATRCAERMRTEPEVVVHQIRARRASKRGAAQKGPPMKAVQFSSVRQGHLLSTGARS